MWNSEEERKEKHEEVQRIQDELRRKEENEAQIRKEKKEFQVTLEELRKSVIPYPKPPIDHSIVKEKIRKNSGKMPAMSPESFQLKDPRKIKTIEDGIEEYIKLFYILESCTAENGIELSLEEIALINATLQKLGEMKINKIQNVLDYTFPRDDDSVLERFRGKNLHSFIQKGGVLAYGISDRPRSPAAPEVLTFSVRTRSSSVGEITSPSAVPIINNKPSTPVITEITTVPTSPKDNNKERGRERHRKRGASSGRRRHSCDPRIGDGKSKDGNRIVKQPKELPAPTLAKQSKPTEKASAVSRVVKELSGRTVMEKSGSLKDLISVLSPNTPPKTRDRFVESQTFDNSSSSEESPRENSNAACPTERELVPLLAAMEPQEASTPNPAVAESQGEAPTELSSLPATYKPKRVKLDISEGLATRVLGFQKMIEEAERHQKMEALRRANSSRQIGSHFSQTL